jgi:hypothetical protein
MTTTDNTSANPTTARTPSIAATASRVAVVLFHVLLFAMILVRPDIDPYWHTISEYAIGPWGWLMQLAFLTAALSYGLLVVYLWPRVTTTLGYAGLALLVVCTVALIAAGLFVTDPLDTPAEALTTRGTLHSVGSVVQLVGLPAAALLLNLGLARRSAGATKARLLWTALLPLVALAGFVLHLSIFILPLGDHAYGPGVPLGWPVRFVLLAYGVWVWVLASQSLYLRDITRNDHQSRGQGPVRVETGQ